MAKPEKVFKMGGVRASIFRNPIVRDGHTVKLAKVVIEVRYRDKAGQWQGTNSLSINDLPKASTALQQAYEYLLGSSDGGPDDPELRAAFEEDDAPEEESAGNGYKPKITTWKPGQRL